MKDSIIRDYFRSVGLMLVLFGLLKWVSMVLGDEILLRQADEFLGLEIRYVLAGVGLIEVVWGILIMKLRRTAAKSVAVLLISGQFVLIRVARRLFSNVGECICMGSATDWLPMTSITREIILVSFIVFMVTGGFIGLLYSRLRTETDDLHADAYCVRWD